MPLSMKDVEELEQLANDLERQAEQLDARNLPGGKSGRGMAAALRRHARAARERLARER